MEEKESRQTKKTLPGQKPYNPKGFSQKIEQSLMESRKLADSLAKARDITQEDLRQEVTIQAFPQQNNLRLTGILVSRFFVVGKTPNL